MVVIVADGHITFERLDNWDIELAKNGCDVARHRNRQKVAAIMHRVTNLQHGVGIVRKFLGAILGSERERQRPRRQLPHVLRSLDIKAAEGRFGGVRVTDEPRRVKLRLNGRRIGAEKVHDSAVEQRQNSGVTSDAIVVVLSQLGLGIEISGIEVPTRVISLDAEDTAR